MSITPIKDPGWSDDDPILTPAEMNDFQAKLIGAGSDIDSTDARLLRLEKRALAEALFLRPLTPENAGSTDGIAAVSLENGGFSEGLGALVITDYDARIVRDDLRGLTVETFDGSLDIIDAAYQYGGDRIVVGYSVGIFSMYTDDFGATWSVTGALGFAPTRIIWNEALQLFIAASATTTVSRMGPVFTTWTSATHSLSSGGNGLACFASGRTAICGLDSGTPRISISDNAIAWSDSAGFPDDGGGPTWLAAGSIAGTNGPKIWHAGFIGNPASQLRISESSDGVTWTTIAEFSTADDAMPPPALQPTTNPRLLYCPNTGLLVVLGIKSGLGVWAIASRDGGVTWGDPAFFRTATGLGQFALANGKLFHTSGTIISMSDGIGWR